MKYDFAGIEQRWQQYWAQHHTFRAPNPGDPGFDPDRPKFYVLDMFPYPSGVGLHVGHPLGYIATDIIARYKRMTGHNVLHPMGYDAFGLPAEQFAVEHGVHPRITTEKNIENMTRQLKRLGLSYDWDRCLSTTDPGYYRWTQWIFLQLYHAWFDPVQNQARPIGELVQRLESEAAYVGPDGELIDAAESEGLDAITGTPIGARKWHELTEDERRDFLDDRRLAYLDEVPVNWCPALGTVLANEEVTNDGRSERGNHPVFKRPLKQWMLRITEFALRLLEDLDLVDWPEPIKIMQRNWIGRSDGARVDFAIDPAGNDAVEGEIITVFTTRPDTLFGATYMVLAPEHPLVEVITTEDQRDAVTRYRQEAQAKADVDRQADAKEKTGVFTGAYAVNPVNQEKIPIWIADYVMMGYGTGAIMAVPAHDDRDFEFAGAFGLPIRDVVYTPPLAAVGAFGERFELDPFDEELAHHLLADFIGYCVNRPGLNYDEAWSVISSRRREGSGGSPGISSRGTISTIWRDAVDGLMKNDLRKMLEAAKHGRLIEFLGTAVTEDGSGVHSANGQISLNGLPTPEAKRVITDWLAEQGVGKHTVQYKLRDWLFSRQRYWGEPFPVLHGPDGRVVALDESDLPVELPEMEDFKPTGSDDPDAPPQPPLTRAADEWKTVERDGTSYQREMNTMPQWAGSCWYYLRFCDPHNDQQMTGQEAEHYWMGRGQTDPQPRSGGVDLYVGGAEHAVLHLLYARFWHKALYDLGHVGTPEPFARLFNQGYIQAHAYTDARGVYVPADEIEEKDGQYFYQGEKVNQEFGKMGKSLKNAVTPDEICEQYGCDTLRLYEMYLGPLDQSKIWRTRDIVGVHRFLQRLWRNFIGDDGQLLVTDAPPPDDLRRRLHRVIKKVTDDIERLSINTAIAAMIELNNDLVALPEVPREAAEVLALLLSPMAPHISEELWQRLGHETSLAHEPWPTFNPRLLVDETVEYPIQLNGKLKSRMTVPADADPQQIEQAALADDYIQALIGAKPVKKVIVIPGKMVNIVAKG